MPKARPKTRSSTTPVPERRWVRVPPLLIVIVLVGAFLRLWHIDSVIGGFHDHNEANYTLMARNFTPPSLLFPNPDGHLFLETPPFYAYVLGGLFELTGISVLAARLVSVACSLGLIVSTLVLGRRLFGQSAGLAAALLVAISPVAVVTGRNVQTDSMFVFLLVTALVFYWRAQDVGSRAAWLRFGLLFGLATFTKLFAVVALPALVLWEGLANRDRRTFRQKGFWMGLAVAAALPLFFYGFHALRDFSYVRGQVIGGAAASTTFPTSTAQWSSLLAEAFWAFSPLVALFFAAAAAAALWKPSRETLFALLPLAAFTVFYLIVHKHSYYLLAVLPFAALLAGRFTASLRMRPLRVGLPAAAAATGALVTLVDLTSMKLGFTEFSELGRVASGIPGATHPLLVTREMLDSHGTVVLFYDPRSRLITLEDLPREPDGRLQLAEADATPYILSFVSPQTPPLPAGWLLERDRYGLELFGWSFAEAHSNPHFFREGGYVRLHTGGPFDFGLRPLRSYPAMALLPVPKGMALYVTPEGLKVRPAPPSAP